MKFQQFGIIFFTAVLFPSLVIAASEAVSVLPTGEEIGWAETQTIICRTENDLFDYMNGGAEIYFGFNFKRLAVRKYLSTDNIGMTIEVYLLKSDADAYGLMSMLPIDAELQLGDWGSYSVGVLRFIAGPYYCRIYLDSDFSHYGDLIKKAGEITAGKISARGKIPELVNLMPTADRKRDGLHYFHDYIAFKNLYYLHPQNILQLDKNTNVVMGDFFNFEADDATLILIQYPDNLKSSAAYKNIIEKLFGKQEVRGLKNSLYERLEQGKWGYVELNGKYILVGIGDNQNAMMMNGMKELKAKLSAFIKGR